MLKGDIASNVLSEEEWLQVFVNYAALSARESRQLEAQEAIQLAIKSGLCRQDAEKQKQLHFLALAIHVFSHDSYGVLSKCRWLILNIPESPQIHRFIHIMIEAYFLLN